ncbi:MAG TPA: alpha/beta fold hydrolase [Burkholderiales bacterium]|nr:alpha/beta fold hydrolase [Burkholderiales bacterium]
MSPTAPVPFRIHVDDAVLDDLRRRLAGVRWPDEVPGNDWKYGTGLAYLKSLVGYWRDGYDWRPFEAMLNGFRQFKVRLAGIDLHFLHEPGKGPEPMPLLLSHGWPGSVFEFHKLIPLLTDPVAHGGDARDAFTVIAPSLPGYTFSFAPGQKRFAIEEIAEVFAELMTGVLGYRRFAAQGGDWGAFITSRLGYAHPDKLHGIHLNLLAVRRDPKLLQNPSAEEKKFLDELNYFLKEETGYQWIQGTKPQTLAYALTDSPVGLAAWITEKFHTWTDCNGDLDRHLGRDVLLTNIMLYWATGAIGSSFWPYYARMHGPWPIPDGAQIKAPTGYVEFPKEILRPPRSVAERTYADIRRWTVAERGGHFAALEQPEFLAQEIRAFFRPLRG